MVMPVGMVMVNMHSVNQPMPTLFEDSPNDSPALKAIKALIVGMTQFHGKDRTKLEEVVRQLKDYGGQMLDPLLSLHRDFALRIGHSIPCGLSFSNTCMYLSKTQPYKSH